LARLAGTALGLRLLARTDALVVIVDCNRERLLGAVLTDRVTVELLGDLFWARVLGTFLRLFLGDDVVAERDALVTDENPRARNQLADLASPLAAEGAVEIVHEPPSNSILARVLRFRQQGL